MTIFGIGTDIVEINRIKKIFIRSGDRFAMKILTSFEFIQYQKNINPVRFLAKRFAIKEASSKALGIGFRNGVSFSHFEVYNDFLGKPNIRLLYKAADLACLLSITGIYVTLSDVQNYVCTTVIFEK